MFYPSNIYCVSTEIKCKCMKSLDHGKKYEKLLLEYGGNTALTYLTLFMILKKSMQYILNPDKLKFY
jgi:hypothetical protein